MRKRLEIVLNSPTAEDRVILSYWWNGINGRRFMRKGSFDVEKWERAQGHILIAPGADARAAWKDAWRFVRAKSRNKILGFHGYILLDDAAHVGGEALPLL